MAYPGWPWQMAWSQSSSCTQKRRHFLPQQVVRVHPYGHRQQDLQQHQVWKIIQNNYQTWREMPIWIHSWSWMSRRHIQYLKNSTSKTKPQPPNMGGIRRPSQVLRHLQPCITHFHTGKIWRTPKTILSHQTHVLKIIFKLTTGKIETSIDLKFGDNQG